MKILLSIVLFLLIHFSFAQQMRIGVMTAYNLKQLELSPDKGKYYLFADSLLIDTLETTEFIVLQSDGAGKLTLKYKTEVKTGCSKLILLQEQQGGALILTGKNPVVKPRKYQDNFEFTAVKGAIKVVNLVEQENYLAGVIESEGGGGGHLEYYKVQALMSRTYALQNCRRHEKEGFELCDQVHCQAYHQMLRFTPLIREAVESTRGEVLVDQRRKMVSTYFHANCGGQTCDASYIWNTSIPYLESFKDTFCIYTKQAKWTKSIDKMAWRNFLVKEYGYPEFDPLIGPLLYTFEQEERKAFYIHPSLGIPLRDLREKFGLKSTYFSTHLEGDKVIVEGRGFGHGVGLCQEGAMKMAKSGFDYRQIALFYFTGVRIVNYEDVLFFNQRTSENWLEDIKNETLR